MKKKGINFFPDVQKTKVLKHLLNGTHVWKNIRISE